MFNIKNGVREPPLSMKNIKCLVIVIGAIVFASCGTVESVGNGISGTARNASSASGTHARTGQLENEAGFTGQKPCRGMTRDQVVSVMGYPSGKISVNGRETWTYNDSNIWATRLRGMVPYRLGHIGGSYDQQVTTVSFSGNRVSSVNTVTTSRATNPWSR